MIDAMTITDYITLQIKAISGDHIEPEQIDIEFRCSMEEYLESLIEKDGCSEQIYNINFLVTAYDLVIEGFLLDEL